MTYDPEATYQDADLEMAEMEAVGAVVARAERAGRCTHQSTVLYRSPAVYPEQEGLGPGQSRCRDCLRVFTSDEDHYEAMERAMYP